MLKYPPPAGSGSAASQELQQRACWLDLPVIKRPPPLPIPYHARHLKKVSLPCQYPNRLALPHRSGIAEYGATRSTKPPSPMRPLEVLAKDPRLIDKKSASWTTFSIGRGSYCLIAAKEIRLIILATRFMRPSCDAMRCGAFAPCLNRPGVGNAIKPPVARIQTAGTVLLKLPPSSIAGCSPDPVHISR